MVFSKKKSDGFKNFEELNFGYSSAVGFFVCVGVGYWADQRWNTGFCFTLIGLFLGFCFIGYEVWKIVQNLNDPDQKKK
jgi:F0F1-type ATP synthase assembly protein I